MSQSTDGILVFGFDVGEENPVGNLFTDEIEEFDDLIISESGLPHYDGNNTDDYREYWSKIKAVIDACPVDIISHCSGDYPMYIVAVRGTYHNASRGYPEALSADAFNVPQEKIDAAQKWCEDHGVEWQAPSWLLASMWH